MTSASSASSAPAVRHIVCVGAGYVGGPTMAMIAHKCPGIQVTLFDLSAERIAAWQSDVLPIYEPGLTEIVRQTRGRNLHFTTDEGVMREADIIFIAVNTPTKASGIGAGRAADLSMAQAAARSVARICRKATIVVEKSTVPVKTASAIEAILRANSAGGVSFEVLSNPEFLAEGTAMDDLNSPDRVLIGGRQNKSGLAAAEALAGVYAQWVPRERILTTNLWSSELSKLVANAFLAQRISSINSISAVCEATGADVDQVAGAIGIDTRIGPKFLKASVGFGGSCFQKDILNLSYIASTLGLTEVADYWSAVVAMNDYQKNRFVAKVIQSLFNTVRNKRIAVLGFAFKKDTGDTRESAAIDVCKALLDDGAKLAIYDPKVSRPQMREDLELDGPSPYGPAHNAPHGYVGTEHAARVEHCACAAEACEGAHALLVLTEWDEFKVLDFAALYKAMAKPAFAFDGRNILPLDQLAAIGFQCFGVGKPIASYMIDGARPTSLPPSPVPCEDHEGAPAARAVGGAVHGNGGSAL
eukprot:CAMPEP_0119167716 /NCGR_PEP_ID=MMETSP1315-20130426/6737_1 /TAXON_ID=676789 /ORGANISM="Prasinoderma singularis, Strain RCC927" /LENGTH=528 /DNA_ID=CAMNT_0007161181 /DNA_START=64 /DNA_END=1650 /DNA_ORIENTATION=+